MNLCNEEIKLSKDESYEVEIYEDILSGEIVLISEIDTGDGIVHGSMNLSDNDLSEMIDKLQKFQLLQRNSK